MKKRFLGILITILTLFSPIISNASVTTYERNENEHLGIWESIEITPYRKDIILKTPKVDEKEKVYDFAAQKNLEVVYVTGNSKIDKYKKTFATIPQWLSLIDNAEYVVTNSFHCCVFSLIFAKNFAAVPLTKTMAGMNSRIETLCEIFGIKPRWVTSEFSDDFSVLEEKVNPVLQIENDFDLEEVLNV